ncbi:longevity assurance proteins LAG1/LAC1 [Russula ochroleuca]|uniref:Longevity assurance proteins LAG1/LAC1 n=1 Tax=Russula ochroleuca TaxID=152965 RepID=A0A9P5MZ31_9AGAM|nr:longevity assurance proteins LAG1/LAC1 [Russula ochroleuca]
MLLPKSRGFRNDLKTGPFSLRILLLPIFLHIIWTLFTPSLILSHPPPSPLSPLLFISHPTPSPTDDSTDPRYRKGWLDLLFIAYYVVFFSFVRQSVLFRICYPIARYCGIRKRETLARFGEQGYAIFYFSFFGAWGLRIMSRLPTWWYNCPHFWIDYPHWQMTPGLKRYYLMQASYWCHQLIVLVLRLEKPRKDFKELVAHHIVTLWLIGWSYGINLTLIGNAVYASMDIPDFFFAMSKLFNYLSWKRTQNIMFIIFVGVWTYFRHYLNLVMLYSVYTDFDLIPQSARSFEPRKGVWMVWWVKWQIFTPLLLLQCLNLFWYFLICRILWRVVTGSSLKDDRSDDEGEDDEPSALKKKKRS